MYITSHIYTYIKLASKFGVLEALLHSIFFEVKNRLITKVSKLEGKLLVIILLFKYNHYDRFQAVSVF